MGKSLIALAVLIFSTTVFAQVKACTTDSAYKNTGWEVVYPKDFDAFYAVFEKVLKAEIQSGELVDDLDSILSTTSSVQAGSSLYMRAQTWDRLSTPRDEMYGDLAVFTNKFAPEEVLEVRWYTNSKKFVAVNSKHLRCVSVIVPYAVNSIL